MIFRYFNLFRDDPALAVLAFAATCISLIVAVTFHEYSHSLVATRLGDHTSRRLGRLTLNPLSHFEWLGALMLLLVGFGWGRPVPVDASRLRVGARAGMAAVALAGPFANVVIAALVFQASRITALALPGGLGAPVVGGPMLGVVISEVVYWNLLLAAFNLLPIAPLDGFKVALGVLPRTIANQFARLEPFGIFILLGVVFIGSWIPGPSVLQRVVEPMMKALGFIALGGQAAW